MILIVTVRSVVPCATIQIAKRKPAALSLRSGFLLLVAYLRYNRGDRSKFLEARPRSPLRLRASIAPATTRATDLVKS